MTTAAMKRTFVLIMSAIVLMSMASCKKYERTERTREGVLSLEEFQLQLDQTLLTKAEAAPGSYAIFIKNPAGATVVETSYAQVKSDGGKLTLPAGDYIFEARSTSEEVPVAEFDKPIYGVKESFSIAAGETTSLGSLVCTLLQVKATVSYDDAFLDMVTGNGKATVTVNPAAPLDFDLTYSGGKASYTDKAGYYAVNESGNTTMNIVFSGSISGKSQKMVANLTGIQARQWRQIKFVKKTDEEGNATFAVEINSFVDDEELLVTMELVPETVIGPDPRAPKGDGGIRIDFAEDCTMYDDLNNIVVPAGATGMDLRVVVTVPGGIKKFLVQMASTSEAFLASVALAGGTTLDLINPAPEQDIVFQIVPFPHGSELAGKTQLQFDLSGAQEPINAFPGRHTFTMEVTDLAGCKNSIPVTLVVNG